MLYIFQFVFSIPQQILLLNILFILMSTYNIVRAKCISICLFYAAIDIILPNCTEWNFLNILLILINTNMWWLNSNSICLYSNARVIPNERGWVEVRLHLPRHLYNLGAWKWGSDDAHMEKLEVSSRNGGGLTPLPGSPAIRALLFYR